MHPPRAIPDLHAPVSTALRPSTTDLVGLAPQMFTRVTNLPGPARSGVTSDPFALSGARSVSPDGSSCGSLSAPLGGAKTSWRSCWKVRASVQDLWRVSDQERRSSAKGEPP